MQRHLWELRLRLAPPRRRLCRLRFLGQARTLSATTMMTAEGSRLGIPQGELSGDRANMIAWLKIIGPLIYGQLAAHGRSAGVPTAPFVLNMLLAMSSAVLGTMTL